MATHSSVLAWRIPGTGEPGELPSTGSQSRTRLKRLSSSSSDLLSCSLALSGFPGFVALVSRVRNLPPPHLRNDSLLWFTDLGVLLDTSPFTLPIARGYKFN